MKKTVKRTLTLALTVIMLTQTALASVYADEPPVDTSGAATEAQVGDETEPASTGDEAAPAADETPADVPTEPVAPEAPAEPENPVEPEAPADEPAEPVVNEAPAASQEEPAGGAPVSEEPAEVPAPAAEPAPNSIVLQPQDTTVNLGEWATFSVSVNGAVKSYKWQCSKNDGANWSTVNSSSAKPNVLYIKPTIKQIGWLYRCVVTFKDKQTVTSDAARLTVINTNNPAQTFDVEDEDTGITVKVDAPLGALPAGTEMKLTALTEEKMAEVKEAVNGSVIAAIDIAFWNGNKEIEPLIPIKVSMSSKKIEKVEAPVVMHIADETGEAKEVEQVAEPSADDEVVFESKNFSVYAIVEEGQEENARLFVRFHQIDGSVIEIPVKKTDNETEVIDGETVNHFEEVLYDPGIGTLAEGKAFRGWTTVQNYEVDTPSKTIEEVRTDVLAMLEAGVTDGQKIDYYPLIANVRYVSYLDELGASIKNDVIFFLDGKTTTYTVKQTYSPREQDSRFEGWAVATWNEDQGQYVKTSTIYQNDQTITFSESSENIVLLANVPKGHWLIFDENGKGASYTAPQFLRLEEKPTEPSDPIRTGYQFLGWYTGTKDGAGNITLGSRFNAWNSTLAETTTLYANWRANTTAPYTVVIWTENLDGVNYDYYDSFQLTGNTNQAISSISVRGGSIGDDDSYARIEGRPAGRDVKITGFHLKEITYSPENSVNPEGNTIVNVRYERTSYTLTFQGLPRATGTEGQQVWVYTFDGNNETLRYRDLYYHNGKWYTTRYGNSYWGYTYYDTDEYKGGVYSSDYYTNVKTVTQKFGTDISSLFPVVGTNGVTYDQGERWKPQSNTVGWNQVFIYQETMPAGDVTLRVDYPARPLKTMIYWVEALPTDSNTVDAPDKLYNASNQTVQGRNKKFIKYKTLSARYNGVTKEDLIPITGFEFFGVDSKTNHTNPTGWIWDSSKDQTINIYYTRKTYNIYYKDGSYFNDKNRLTETRLADFGKSEDEFYNASLAEYNEGGSKYDTYVPTRAGYVFEGWYLDESCSGDAPYTFTKMPEGGLTVYAKWQKVQYRVFLHPNVTETEDPEFSLGGQSTSFRLNYGDKISPIEGIRDLYEQVGWYTSYNSSTGEFSGAWNFDAYVGNDSNITTPYNKTEDTELNTPWALPIESGNKDAAEDRFWINRKLDLYAKWRLKMIGAQGIQVIYDAVEGAGHFSDNTTTMNDPVGFYTDEAIAIAAGAAIADSETQQFKYWVVQKWNGTEFVDTDIHVYPGGEFTVLKKNAHEEDIPGTTHDDQYYLTYKIHVRAEYGSIEAPTPTHINWYSNVITTDESALDLNNFTHTGITKKEDNKGWYVEDVLDENDEYALGINQAIPIRAADTYTYPGLTFLGWSKLPIDKAPASQTSAVNDLFLKWVPATDTVAAHYEAKDDNGNWVKVTEVAADENRPYDDLYAVWAENYFYVYHSSTGKLEAVSLTQLTKQGEYDLTKKTAGDTLYGGYYSACGAVPTNGITADVKRAASSNKADKQTKVSGAVTYDATSLKTGDNRFWTRANAAKVERTTKGTNGQETTGAVEAGSGDKVKPVKDDVFYLKEVPSCYLQTNARWVYDWADGYKIKNIYMLTTMDDSLYTELGYIVVTNNQKARIVSKFSYQQRNSDVINTVTIQDLLKKSGKMGYIGVVDATGKIDDIETGSVSMLPYWKTLDGVEIKTAGYTFSSSSTADLTTSTIRYAKN